MRATLMELKLHYPGMQKIPGLISNRYVGRRVTKTTVNPDCSWIFERPTIARRKWNGICVSFDGNDWWARWQVGPGQREPRGFVPVDFNEMTEDITGWVPIENSLIFKHWDRATQGTDTGNDWLKGTYELVGPRCEKNAERLETNMLIRHMDAEQVAMPELVTCEALFDLVTELHNTRGWEGLVFSEKGGFGVAKLKFSDL